MAVEEDSCHIQQKGEAAFLVFRDGLADDVMVVWLLEKAVNLALFPAAFL